MTLGYLPQDGLALRGKTVFAECLSVFDPIFALEREAEEITHTLSTADPKSREYLAAADRYSDIADQLHVHDIYTLDSQVGAVLGGLGFTQGRLGAQDRRVLRRLADAHRAGQTAAAEAVACCCWTSRRTIWISNRATGWKTTCTTIPTPTS